MSFNADNGRLFLAQSTDSHKKVNFTNADTSLSTVCCNKPFLLEGKNNLHFMLQALQHTGYDDL